MTEFPRRAEAPGVHPDAPAVPAADVVVTGLMVATPMAGGGLCDMAFASGLDALRGVCLARGIRLSTVFLRGESDVQQARNRCFAQFLASDHSHLLFVDADIGFSPDAVLRLIAHDKPIVGATYAKKAPGPVQFAVSLLPRAERTDTGLVDVNGLPGGFLMIQRAAAERMAGAYRDLAFDPQDGQASTEAWRNNLLNVFGAELSERTRWSEDIAFCRRWRALGGQVWLDPYILLEHWGMARFSGYAAPIFRPADEPAPPAAPPPPVSAPAPAEGLQILLGCGRSRDKKLHLPDAREWRNLRTVDISPDVGADIVHDLTELPLPFADDSAAEIHLYDVLEHTQRQGDWRGFFAEFAEFWRILQPGGHLFAICPRWDGVWAWGDPGHTRVIQAESLTYLSQAAYIAECDGPQRTNRTDYRFVWRGDFDLVWTGPVGEHQAGFVLRAIKPSRWRPPA